MKLTSCAFGCSWLHIFLVCSSDKANVDEPKCDNSSSDCSKIEIFHLKTFPKYFSLSISFALGEAKKSINTQFFLLLFHSDFSSSQISTLSHCCDFIKISIVSRLTGVCLHPLERLILNWMENIFSLSSSSRFMIFFIYVFYESRCWEFNPNSFGCVCAPLLHNKIKHMRLTRQLIFLNIFSF